MQDISKYKVGICTLGCRVNQYESRAISEYIEAYGGTVVPFENFCDVYIINTCAVTAESERKSRQMARRAHKQNPSADIIMTGCQAQLHPQDAARLPGVRYVGGNASKLDAAREALRLLSERSIAPADGENRAAPVISDMLIGHDYECYGVRTPDHTRAYVKIEDGCENKCAYCVIPKVRGPVRSKPADQVIDEVTALSQTGYKEVVLTGIETCSYQYGLADIIKRIAQIDGIERIRLSSANPSFINKRFADEIKGVSKFCPHFHLSLQSFCDRTLNAMRRRYNTRMIFENCGYLRECIPNICFTADMICGFPGESDEDFAETLKNTEKLGLLFAHIFPYSDRPGTEASEMKEKIDETVKNERCAALRETVLKSRRRIISDFAAREKVFAVLFETEKDGYMYGHTENFIEVKAKGTELCGSIASVKLKDGTDGITFEPTEAEMVQ